MIGFIKYINYKDGYGYISIPDRATLTQLIYMIVITIDLRISRHRKFYNNIACKSSVSIGLTSRHSGSVKYLPSRFLNKM